MSQEFSLSTTITLNGSGAGTAQIGPQYPREWWELDKAGIYIPAGGFPICTIFVGATATPDHMVDQTYTGAGDSTGRVSGHTIHAGEFVFAVWQAGIANVPATLTVWGAK